MCVNRVLPVVYLIKSEMAQNVMKYFGRKQIPIILNNNISRITKICITHLDQKKILKIFDNLLN